MIQVHPRVLRPATDCPDCGGSLKAGAMRWQGIHSCVESRCARCGRAWVEDLPVGHAQFAAYTVDVPGRRLFGPADSRAWFGQPLLDSLSTPSPDPVGLKVERFKKVREAVLLNCLDFLYGHALLKLLNFQDEARRKPVIALVPHYLRWMVPAGAAEVWSVDLSPRRSLAYYPALDAALATQVRRFQRLWLSPAHSHPRVADISAYTGVPRALDPPGQPHVTFIWREDRLWGRWRLAQRGKVLGLFRRLREAWPAARFSVAGLGRPGGLPDWVQDARAQSFDAQAERGLCRLYAASSVVIGVHGSNMLLPTAQAPLSLTLMPDDRWGNLFQDSIIQERDARLAMHRHRYLPWSNPVALIAQAARRQVEDFPAFVRQLAP